MHGGSSLIRNPGCGLKFSRIVISWEKQRNEIATVRGIGEGEQSNQAEVGGRGS